MKIVAVGTIETDMRFPKSSKRAGKKVCLIEVIESRFFGSNVTRLLTDGDYREAMKKPVRPLDKHLPAFLSKKEAAKFNELFFPNVGRNPSRL
jgi:hypothetical protein